MGRTNSSSEKVAFHKRIHEERLFDQYVNLREWLKSPEGGSLKAGIAWKIAALQFQRKDGGPHEITVTPELAAIIKGTPAAAPRPAPAAEPASPPRKRGRPRKQATDSEPFLDGSIGISDNEPDESAPSPSDPPIAPEPKLFGFTRTIKENTVEWHGAWADLTRQVDPNRKAGTPAIIVWVFENVATPIGEIPPDDVPCRGAIPLLKWAITHYDDFIKVLFVKTMPDKRTLEWEQKHADDGRAQLDKLAQFESSWRKQMEKEDDEDDDGMPAADRPHHAHA